MSKTFGKYILDGKKVIPVNDVLEWAKWIGNSDRRVAITMVEDVEISTVFLGLDHNFISPGRPPLLFETMVFSKGGGELDNETRRYATWTEAEEGHKEVVKKVKNAL